MNLQFYKWNNYYNRTYKPFSLTEASNALVGSILNVNGFNPNDGVDTEQMTGLNTFTEIPDYCVVVDGTEIISKWFVIECQRTRQGQYKLSLHRRLRKLLYSSRRGGCPITVLLSSTESKCLSTR